MSETARSALRDGTRDHHDRVDALFGRFDLRGAEGYTRFLQAQAAAHLPIEAAIDAGFGDRLLEDWPQRRRGDRLRADLAALGAGVPPLEPPPPLPDDDAALGAVYVLEGSRLGGAYLRRTVPPGFPTTYLAPAPANLWRDLLKLLERRLTTLAARQAAVAAAQAAFAVFETSGRGFSKTA